MLYPTALIALVLQSIVEASPSPIPPRYDEKSLNWTPCDLDFPEGLESNITEPIDCATVKVPLDYTSDSDEVLQLQLIKINATKEPVKGSVIFNPGGPGSSGVEEVALSGSLYREVLGGHFNIIGFDPRGTGRTIPYSCNLTTPNSGTVTARNPYAVIPVEDGYELLKSKAWEDAKVLTDACAKNQKATGHLVGTAFTARDMLAIVDALQEDGLLRFWGRSYSTVLGQTFAAMFPDRVGRILLDSVFLAEDYHSGRWLGPTRDVEFALTNFFSECIDAGPTLCPLANFTGSSTTPAGLTQALAKAFDELIQDPIVLPETYPARYWWQPGGLTLLNQLKFSIMNSLFKPATFPYTYQLTQFALARNWTALEEILTTAEQAASNPGPAWNLGKHAFHGIGCSDGAFRADSPQDLYSLIQAQVAQGSFADAFGPQAWVCARWKQEAAERYQGSWSNITTKSPILLVNGRYDPITPLSGAWETAVRFPGSRLVVHEGAGHGVMNHPSNCTINVIGNYFVNGTLPKHGTKCQPNKSAFDVILESVPDVEE